nr:hypothetical protein CFP56_34958 [Quercus suber]
MSNSHSVVIDMVANRNKIGCNVFMAAIKLVAEIGSAAIPGVGEAIDGGMIAGITAAKLFSYTYDTTTEAASAFESWGSSICGTSAMPSNAAQVFIALDNAPSLVLPGRTWFLCREESKSAKELKTQLVTCDANKYVHPDACAHYFSAIHARGLKSVFTCEDANQRVDVDHTVSWYRQHAHAAGWGQFTKPTYQFKGSKGKIEVRQPSCQADEWPPAYFLPTDETLRNTKEWGQAIRWLPAAENSGAGSLWRGFCTKHDGGDGNGQRVKPPKIKDGDKDTKEKTPKELLPLNLELVEPGKSELRSHKGKDGKQTSTIIYEEVTYTRAVFDLRFDFEGQGAEMPTKENDWMLKANPCWPEDILTVSQVPDDPGFVLLTDDPCVSPNSRIVRPSTDRPARWYETHKFPQGYDAAATKALYAKAPNDNILKAAKQRKHDRPSTPDDQPPTKQPSKRLEIIAGGDLVLRDDISNSTRRLTPEELLHNVEVLDCADPHCSREKRRLVEDDDGTDASGAYLFIPGTGPARIPAANVVAVSTLVVDVPTGTISLRRTPLSDERPRPTASSGSTA